MSPRPAAPCCSAVFAHQPACRTRYLTGRGALTEPQRCPGVDAPAPKTGPITLPPNGDEIAKRAKPFHADPHHRSQTTNPRPSKFLPWGRADSGTTIAT